MRDEAVASDQPTQFGLGWEVAVRQPAANGLTVTTYARNTRRYDVVSSADTFYNIAYKEFDLLQVCQILLHENRSFGGHKDALAAALCGWILGSQKSMSRRRLIALSVGTTLARAEQAVTRSSTKENKTRYNYPRTTRLSPSFFNELYYPIGGLRTILRTPTNHGIYQELEIQRNHLYNTIRIAAVDHYHYLSCTTNRLLDEISAGRSCKAYILAEFFLNGSSIPNVANLKSNYLARFEESIPFLYAASSISLPDKQTLLEAIAAVKWSVILRQGILKELFGRTLFYAQNIYAKNKRAKRRIVYARNITDALRGVEPRSFDPPDWVNACSRIIEHSYTKTGYDACHDGDVLRPKNQAFWSALDLQVPTYN